MPNFSYVQTDFRGGIWSPSAQGRMESPAYKTALNECLNSMPQEDGSWTRRPGFRYIAHPKWGATGKLLPFRFSRSQSYQAELTPGYLRFVVGLTLLRDEPEKPLVVNINRQTPAKVKVTALTWANGDTVMFNITSVPPQSLRLYGRQFTIQNVNATTGTFTLYDALTGLPVDGNEIAWFNYNQADTVQRVLEYVTPYTAADIPNVRIVQDSDGTVLFLCPGKKTYALVISGATQFTFGVADFKDGPYFDENELVTTMSLSGTSGSVTVTASGTAGINNGDGFKVTDIGRLIWFQGGPAAWSNAIPYAKEAKVLGSDNNIYRSLVSNNINNDPTTDNGTKWEITADVVAVTWLQITAWTSTTVVTATVRGAATTSGVATIHWRMGVYSDTTGYPTCGAYHEARIILAGAVPNRFDLSKSFKALEFSPTEVDGTISDNNGVSGVLNNRDSEIISWMLSTDEGLAIGTMAGEWMLKASALDDPLSPTSAQARNPTNTGSADIEAMQIYGSPVFVQARQRKIMTHKRVDGKFETPNQSTMASGLTSPKIMETAWCQEPMRSFFCRLSDGKLIGAIHKVSQIEENFTGWHRHEHGMSRKFEALSSGPNFSGTSDSVFVITAHPTDATAPRWIEIMMPIASEGDPSWVSWHNDGSGTAWYIRRMISANGDAYDGIKVYGLEHLNGYTIHPFIGGLDLGDFVVSGGSINIPYVGSFTAAFLESLDDGTDYSDWGIQLRWADAPVTTNPLYPLNTITVLDNTITSTVSGIETMWDRDNELYYRVDPFGGGVESIRVFNALNGDLVREAVNHAAIFPGNDVEGLLTIFSHGPVRCLVGPDDQHPGGSIFSFLTFTTPPGTTFVLGLIDNLTLVKYKHWETGNDAFDLFPPNSFASFPFIYTDPVTFVQNYNNIGATSQQGGAGRVKIYCLSSGGPLGTQYGQGNEMFSNETMGAHTFHRWFRGFEADGLTVFYSFAPIGNIAITSFDGAETAVVREWAVGRTVDSGVVVSVIHENIFNVESIAVDPLWTDGFGFFTMSYDAVDSTFFVVARGMAGPGNYWRAAKIRRDGTFVWNVLFPTSIPNPRFQLAGPWNNSRWATYDLAGVVNEINLVTGVWRVFAGQATMLSDLQNDTEDYDEVGPSIIINSNAAIPGPGSPSPAPNLIGDWANDNPTGWGSNNFSRMWHGTSFTQDQEHRAINAEYFFNPVNFGVSFVSRGQLLSPDYGQDAGAALGPAFGKTRRTHRWAARFSRAFNVKIGTDFSTLKSIPFKTPGGTLIVQPTLFSGTISDTLNDDYSYEGKLAWEVTRQYSCTVTAIGGFIATQDR